MFENKKIELIIVCDDKTTGYADSLVQLIGQKDDGDEDFVGTKDGEVSAAIWNEKEYQKSKAEITSDTHVLFIGNNKITQAQTKLMSYKFDKFGMHYGWRGKRAVMFVDKTPKKDDYNNFVDFAKECHSRGKIQLNIEETKAKPDDKDVLKGTAVGAGAIGVAKAAGAAKVLGIAGASIGGWLVAPLAVVPFATFNIVKNIKAKKELADLQYKSLTVKLYLDDLQKFLEE